LFERGDAAWPDALDRFAFELSEHCEGPEIATLAEGRVADDLRAAS
jgi:hypothetical protein